MPRFKYALERKGPKTLELSWKRGWKDLVIKLDRTEIGSISTKNELNEGREFSLTDGSTLKVQLTQKGLELHRNGNPVPGSVSDPVAILRIAYGIIFFLGFASVIAGLIGELFKIEAFQEWFGWPSVIIGVVYIVLGFFAKHRSAIALGIAIFLTGGLLLLRIIGTLSVIAAGQIPLGIGGIIIGIFFLRAMIKGYTAIKELKGE